MELDIDVTRGHHKHFKYLEVRTKGVSKAAFLENTLKTLISLNIEIDFLLTAGDEESDEPLIKRAHQIDMPPVRSGKPAVFTTVIGKCNSEAKVCVESVMELMNILKKLSRRSVIEKKFYSTSDLYSLASSKKAAQQARSVVSSAQILKKARSKGLVMTENNHNHKHTTEFAAEVERVRRIPYVKSAPILLGRSYSTQMRSTSSDSLFSSASSSTMSVRNIPAHAQSKSVKDFLNVPKGEEECPDSLSF
jgi:hypothetical protein